MWVLLTSTGLDPGGDLARGQMVAARAGVELEERTGRGALRRSAELVRGRWLRVGSLVGLGASSRSSPGRSSARFIFVADRVRSRC